ncbi:MAG: leucine-rich repeat domain-containing protein [Bacteroidales bacterium]|nr:leucine-rich repeat domain-containing protein [Candidatus Scybalousia scybalohippi]
MIKRVLSLFMLLSIGVQVFAHDFEAVNSDGKTIYYNITSSTEPRTVAVTYQGTSASLYPNEYTGEINIPSTVTYSGVVYDVTSIGDGAFQFCNGITSVTIPNSVTSIGNYAFHYCSSLTSVAMGNSIASIGYFAFQDCSSLTSITIPNSVTSIGDNAFRACSGATSITMGNSVASIGNSTFRECSGITSITIPSSVTSIGVYAFAGCTNLDTVICKVENPVTIYASTFSNTYSGKKLFVPCSSTSLYNNNDVWSSSFGENIFGVVFDTTYLNVSICQGEEYNDNGFTESTAGLYTYTLTTMDGCDSTINLDLSVREKYYLSICDTICEGSTYTFGDNVLTTSGTYTDTLQSEYGCDSVIVLTLTTVSYHTDTTINISLGESIVFFGQTLTESGTYFQTVPSVTDGCDSTVTLNLIVGCTALSDIESKIAVGVYPNPTEENTILNVEGLTTDAQVLLTDIQGRTIKTYTMKAGDRTLEIETSNMISGAYYIRIISNAFTRTEKIIKR